MKSFIFGVLFILFLSTVSCSFEGYHDLFTTIERRHEGPIKDLNHLREMGLYSEREINQLLLNGALIAGGGPRALFGTEYDFLLDDTRFSRENRMKRSTTTYGRTTGANAETFKGEWKKNKGENVATSTSYSRVFHFEDIPNIVWTVGGIQEYFQTQLSKSTNDVIGYQIDNEQSFVFELDTNSSVPAAGGAALLCEISYGSQHKFYQGARINWDNPLTIFPNQLHKDEWILDLDTGIWTEIVRAPGSFVAPPLIQAGMFYVEEYNKAYVFGGIDGDTFDIFNPTGIVFNDVTYVLDFNMSPPGWKIANNGLGSDDVPFAANNIIFKKVTPKKGNKYVGFLPPGTQNFLNPGSGGEIKSYVFSIDDYNTDTGIWHEITPTDPEDNIAGYTTAAATAIYDGVYAFIIGGDSINNRNSGGTNPFVPGNELSQFWNCWAPNAVNVVDSTYGTEITGNNDGTYDNLKYVLLVPEGGSNVEGSKTGDAVVVGEILYKTGGHGFECTPNATPEGWGIGGQTHTNRMEMVSAEEMSKSL